MADLKVVPLRDGAPSLIDVPGMLRRLADQIEQGEHGEVATLYALMPRSDGYPTLFGWGDQTGENDLRIQLALAQHWLLGRMVERVS